MKTGGIFNFRGLGLVLLALLIPTLGWSQVSGITFASAKNAGSGVMRVTYVETPGFVYRDASGKLTGVCIDIVDDFVEFVRAAHGINLKVEYVGDGNSFSSMYNQTKNGSGGVVGIGNVTITETRKQEVAFTPYFIENKAMLITQKGRPQLTDVSKISETFTGMTAYTTQGSLNEARIMELKNKYWPNMTVKYAASSPEVLEKVVADPKGFAYLDLVFYVEAIRGGKSIQRHAAADDSSEQFGFVLPKGSDWEPVWQAFFNNGIGYRNSSEYDRILREHLGPAAVRLMESTR